MKKSLSWALPVIALAALAWAGLSACGGEEEAAPAPRRVEIQVTDDGYQPGSVEARAGEPLILAFRRTTESTCGEEVVFPGRNLRRSLPLNETVEISITPTEAGSIAFACGMDMLHGTIVVQ